MDHHNPPPPPRYVMLPDPNVATLQPPPGRRNLPRYYSRKNHSSSSSSCCACICLCSCLSLFLLIALSLYILFFFINPKPPSYSVSHLHVAAFDVSPDLSLHSELRLAVKAENPNEQIAIRYGHGGEVVVAYRSAVLCAGPLPVFFQGHGNTTTINVVLKGDSPIRSGIQQALAESKKSGKIPLDIYVKVPVVLRLAGKLDLREVTVSVMCSLVVDSLSPNQKVAIKSAEYKYNLEF